MDRHVDLSVELGAVGGARVERGALVRRQRRSPSRPTAAGYGDQRPVADNTSAEGRARNRRVTILIESRVPGANCDRALEFFLNLIFCIFHRTIIHLILLNDHFIR